MHVCIMYNTKVQIGWANFFWGRHQWYTEPISLAGWNIPIYTPMHKPIYCFADNLSEWHYKFLKYLKDWLWLKIKCICSTKKRFNWSIYNCHYQLNFKKSLIIGTIARLLMNSNVDIFTSIVSSINLQASFGQMQFWSLWANIKLQECHPAG